MLEQTVYIVDDDSAVADSVKELVESVGLNAKTYNSARDFLKCYTSDYAGCLVLDVRMAKMSGLALQLKLNRIGADIPIIFITGYGDINTAVTALKAGAVDFIQKPYHEQNLLDAINNALELDEKKRSFAHKMESIEEQLSELTEREREVMDLLADGLSNKVIAKRLGISPRTVEAHRQHVFQKCKVNSVAQLARLRAKEV